MRVGMLQVPALTLPPRFCNVYFAAIILAVAQNTNSWKQGQFTSRWGQAYHSLLMLD